MLEAEDYFCWLDDRVIYHIFLRQYSTCLVPVLHTMQTSKNSSRPNGRKPSVLLALTLRILAVFKRKRDKSRKLMYLKRLSNGSDCTSLRLPLRVSIYVLFVSPLR